MKLGLYVDDDAVYRNPPHRDDIKWIRAYTFHDAIVMLETHDFSIVSLDHDLGCFYGNKEMTGRDILNWMIDQMLVFDRFQNVEVMVHSANPVGRATMLDDIKRYFT